MVTMSFSRRLFGGGKKEKNTSMANNTNKRMDVERIASLSSDATTATGGEVLLHDHVNIVSENHLNKVWDDLKGGVKYKALKSMKMTFRTEPTRDISKMKHLDDVFVGLGGLPELEDVMFCNATLFLPSVIKLLKKKSSLRTLKFHHCKFILTTKSKKNKEPTEKAIEKLWEGIQQHTKLTILEIVACRYCPYQTMSYESSHHSPSSSTRDNNNNHAETFSFPLPNFLQEQTLPNLRRLVLDQCILEINGSPSFVKLLSHNTSLEELEIHPLFDASSVNRRQQYQVKKQACKEFLLEIIPTTLHANNNSTLRKLVVSIDDYFLDSMYGDALLHWVDLVKDDNHTLTELRATHHPLSSTTKEADNIYGLKTDEWLYCNLQYNLRLNELLAAKQEKQIQQQGGVGGNCATSQSLSPQEEKEAIRLNKKEFLAEILPEAYDVSCLHQLLQPNPDIMDASTQSVPCIDFDYNCIDDRMTTSAKRSNTDPTSNNSNNAGLRRAATTAVTGGRRR